MENNGVRKISLDCPAILIAVYVSLIGLPGVAILCFDIIKFIKNPSNGPDVVSTILATIGVLFTFFIVEMVFKFLKKVGIIKPDKEEEPGIRDRVSNVHVNRKLK